MELQAVTIDGTIIEADGFTVANHGIKLERMPREGDTDKPETIGFVPFDRLMYVIPEEVAHRVEELEEMPT